MKKRLPVFIGLMLAAVLFAGSAMADGTLTATFLYKDPGGAIHPLDNAYVYLHVYPPSGSPIMEKYFRNAQYVLGPSDANGNFSVSVPNGVYRVFIRRSPLAATSTNEYGPPSRGDLIWYSAGSTINVTTGSLIGLGAVYATVFAPQTASISISGKVTNSSGTPQTGWFVMATTAPCQVGAGGQVGGCPGMKYPARELTDSNGNYTINLGNPGTYYVYAQPYAAYFQAFQDEVPYTTCPPYTGGVYNSGQVPVCPVTVGAGSYLTGLNIIAQ